MLFTVTWEATVGRMRERAGMIQEGAWMMDARTCGEVVHCLREVEGGKFTWSENSSQE
jgi:hypothetical protein